MNAGALWLMPISSVPGREKPTPNCHDVLPTVGVPRMAHKGLGQCVHQEISSSSPRVPPPRPQDMQLMEVVMRHGLPRREEGVGT